MQAAITRVDIAGWKEKVYLRSHSQACGKAAPHTCIPKLNPAPPLGYGQVGELSEYQNGVEHVFVSVLVEV